MKWEEIEKQTRPLCKKVESVLGRTKPFRCDNCGKVHEVNLTIFPIVALVYQELSPPSNKEKVRK